MRNKHGSMAGEEEAEEINLTPMLDVVFIMLIFFIVTATFIKEAGVQVNRPDTVTADSQKVAILVAISAADEIWINRQVRDPRAVRGIIERLHTETPQGGVVIQADAESSNEMLVIVMEAAKAAGVKDVSIATDDG
jgi:biopolymer transport protein ExbD